MHENRVQHSGYTIKGGGQEIAAIMLTSKLGFFESHYPFSMLGGISGTKITSFAHEVIWFLILMEPRLTVGPRSWLTTP